MRLYFVLGTLAATVLVAGPVFAGAPAEVRTYTAVYTETPPVIDGIISPGEWDAAVTANPDTGDWRVLRVGTAPVDNENNRFQFMWDDDFLYFQTTSDYNLWSFPDGTDNINFGADNMNLYFDPNLDGEENFPAGFGQDMPFNGVDGYQVAYNQYEGGNVPFTCSACTNAEPFGPGASITQGEPGSEWGFFGEAHLDTLFGNQAHWQGLRDTVGAAIHNLDGGVSELAIPWTDFDAPGGDVNDPEATLDPSLDLTRGGTDPGTPDNGDQWFFNVARISSNQLTGDNLLPSYNWTTSQFFASHPHAVMTFEGAPDFDAGDFDKDGDVDGDDFLAWQSNFGTTEGATQAQGDSDGDGDVDGDDFLTWQAGFGGGGAGAGAGSVPEPTAAVLALLASLALVGRRR